MTVLLKKEKCFILLLLILLVNIQPNPSPAQDNIGTPDEFRGRAGLSVSQINAQISQKMNFVKIWTQ